MLSHQISGRQRLRQQLNYLRLSKNEQRQITRAMGRKVKRFSGQRITQQKDLDGRRFAPRASRQRKKMLRGLKKGMLVQAHRHGAKVAFRGGKVAYKHQHGWKETLTAKRYIERQEKANPSEERNPGKRCSKAQAKALYTLGYKRNTGKNRYRRATQSWMQQNLSENQAGLMIRMLRDKKAKQQWTITTPERAFLGVNRRENAQLMDLLSQRITERVARR